MTRIEITTTVAASPEVCFDLARDLDLHTRSLQHTSERAVAGRTSGLIGIGERVTWEARHFGILHRHTALITQFDRPRHFRDEMVEGRFALFKHDHFFEVIEQGTRMRDVLEFRSPLGVLGRVVDKLILAKYMTRLLLQRSHTIKAAAETDHGPRG